MSSFFFLSWLWLVLARLRRYLAGVFKSISHCGNVVGHTHTRRTHYTHTRTTHTPPPPPKSETHTHTHARARRDFSGVSDTRHTSTRPLVQPRLVAARLRYTVTRLRGYAADAEPPCCAPLATLQQANIMFDSSTEVFAIDNNTNAYDTASPGMGEQFAAYQASVRELVAACAVRTDHASSAAPAPCHPAVQGVADFFAHGQGSAGDATHAPSLGYSMGAEGVLEIERGLVQLTDTLWYASRSLQLHLHPHGGQFDFVWLPARTPHGGASYVW